MVQTSDEPSRETYVETRGGMKYYHSNKPQENKGWYWCFDKKAFFRWSDVNKSLSEIIK
jgi:hypothetical protein